MSIHICGFDFIAPYTMHLNFLSHVLLGGFLQLLTFFKQCFFNRKWEFPDFYTFSTRQVWLYFVVFFILKYKKKKLVFFDISKLVNFM